MPAVQVFRSTDGGAQVLTGLAGSLVDLLSRYLPLLGWTIAYTGTNKAVYRPVAGRTQQAYRCYFRVDQSASLNGRARINGYETMTDVDTGTGAFPANAGDCLVQTSSLINDPAAHDWVLVGDGLTVAMTIHRIMADNTRTAFTFGEFYTFGDDDRWHNMVIGSDGATQDPMAILDTRVNAHSSTVGCFALQRSYTGAAGPIATSGVAYVGNQAFPQASNYTSGSAAYPNTNDTIMLSEIHLAENAVPTVRGKLRGWWHFLHPDTSITAGVPNTFAGASMSGLHSLSGQTFEVWHAGHDAALHCFETSDTWSTNP